MHRVLLAPALYAVDSFFPTQPQKTVRSVVCTHISKYRFPEGGNPNRPQGNKIALIAIANKGDLAFRGFGLLEKGFQGVYFVLR